MTIDPNERVALNHGAKAIIDAADGAEAPSNLAFSKTLLLMFMPEKNHSKAAFWTDPAVFMTKMIPLINRFPAIEENMKQAVQKDSRLTSYAGAYGVDFTTAVSTLGPLITANKMDRAGVKPEHLTAAHFRNALRNHYGDAESPLPLQALYHGVAKMLLH